MNRKFLEEKIKPLQKWMYFVGNREMPQAEICREDPFYKGLY